MNQRYARGPPVSPTPRCDAPAELVLMVDSELNSLRTSFRVLRTSTLALQSELKLLNRVYYKGNSQHRSAMFWHKVGDVRRLTRRMEEVNLAGVVNAFRQSFFTENQNTKRASWSQLPSASDAYHVLRRLSSIAHLIIRALQRCKSTYDALLRQARTAAFLALVTVLLALVARLHSIYVSTAEQLIASWTSINTLYHHLPDVKNLNRRSFPRLPSSLPALAEMPTTLSEHIFNPSLVYPDQPMMDDDDLGQTVSRTTPTPVASVAAALPTEAPNTPPSYPSTTFVMDEVDEADEMEPVIALDVKPSPFVMDEMDEVEPTAAPQAMAPPSEVDPTTAVGPSQSADHPPQNRHSRPRASQKKRRKKHDGLGDEIDAIFGSS